MEQSYKLERSLDESYTREVTLRLLLSCPNRRFTLDPDSFT